MPRCLKQPTKESSKEEIEKYIRYQGERVEDAKNKLIKCANKLQKALNLFDKLYG